MAQETQTIAGVVEAVEFQESTRYAVESAAGVTTPVRVQATIALPDGRKAYVKTTVGERVEFYATEESSFRVAATQRQHPWALWTGREVVSTVWMGDVVQIQGTAETKVSRRGNAYLEVSRARIVGWRRPEWEAQAPVPRAVIREVPATVVASRLTRPTQIAAPPVTSPTRYVERPDPGDEDPTCKHGAVIFRAGDCDECEAEEQRMISQAERQMEDREPSMAESRQQLDWEAMAEAMLAQWD